MMRIIFFFLALILSCNAVAEIRAVRGEIVHYLDNPTDPKNQVYFEDGVLITENGLVKEVGDAAKLLKKYPSLKPKHYKNSIIMPGFIDAHVHYPQVDMIAAFGEQLLDWLNQYTFPAEIRYAKKEHARKGAKVFLSELLRNGTTTALVMAASYPESAEAFFEEAEKLNMRIIGGKVMMDRHAPDALTDNAEASYEDSKKLLKKWHGKGRLLYAITPRFAPTSTPEQLAAAGKLKKEFPDVFVHTHMSENVKEIEWVKELFPKRTGYLDVYDHYGLVGPRALFAHSVHITPEESKVIASKDAAVVFCPSSNLFLGSGLFPMHKVEEAGAHIALGSDMGAGTTLSTFMNLNEAYKIMQLQGEKLSAPRAFYLATLGSAKALHLNDKIGNFEVGKEGDFVVINKEATPFLKYRMQFAKTIDEKLFVLLIMGDDRAIEATYIMGKETAPPIDASKKS